MTTVARDVGSRLRRLLAILTWLAQVGETPIEEAAARFGLEPDALVAELEMAACCGLPPYTPDQLMEIVVTDTTVSAHLGEMLARPRRLSAREGFACIASPSVTARRLTFRTRAGEDVARSRLPSPLEFYKTPDMPMARTWRADTTPEHLLVRVLRPGANLIRRPELKANNRGQSNRRTG